MIGRSQRLNGWNVSLLLLVLREYFYTSILVEMKYEARVLMTDCSPTDPVLAASVVKGVFAEVSWSDTSSRSAADEQRHVPPYIRDLLLVS
jgi:hypothetical protein